MRKLTTEDFDNIIGTYNAGYRIEKARMLDGKFSDSDHYGIALGINEKNNHVTWRFHLEGEAPSYYWGHYFNQDKEAAMTDYEERDQDLDQAEKSDMGSQERKKDNIELLLDLLKESSTESLAVYCQTITPYAPKEYQRILRAVAMDELFLNRGIDYKDVKVEQSLKDDIGMLEDMLKGSSKEGLIQYYKETSPHSPKAYEVVFNAYVTKELLDRGELQFDASNNKFYFPEPPEQPEINGMDFIT